VSVMIFHRATIKPDSEVQKLVKTKIDEELEHFYDEKFQSFDLANDMRELKSKIKSLTEKGRKIGIIIPHDAKWGGIKKNFPNCDIFIAKYGEIIAHH